MALIESNNIIAKLNALSAEPAYQHEGEDYFVGIVEAYNAVRESPAVDASPVIHGEWIWFDNTTSQRSIDRGYRCSVCGRVEDLNNEP